MKSPKSTPSPPFPHPHTRWTAKYNSKYTSDRLMCSHVRLYHLCFVIVDVRHRRLSLNIQIWNGNEHGEDASALFSAYTYYTWMKANARKCWSSGWLSIVDCRRLPKSHNIIRSGSHFDTHRRISHTQTATRRSSIVIQTIACIVLGGVFIFFSVTELTMPLAMETPFALSLSSFYPCMHRQHTQTPSHRHTTNAHIAIYYLASECFGCFALLLLLFCMKPAHFIRTINELFVCYFACVCGKIFADTHLELVLKLCALVTEDANSSSRNDNSSA